MKYCTMRESNRLIVSVCSQFIVQRNNDPSLPPAKYANFNSPIDEKQHYLGPNNDFHGLNGGSLQILFLKKIKTHL